MFNKTATKFILYLIFILSLVYVFIYSNTHYQTEGFITNTKYKNEYEFKDLNGNVWIIYSNDKIEPHTRGYIRIFNNYTDETYDDVITNVYIPNVNIKIEYEKR